MKFVVAGGTGAVGSALIPFLQAAGHEIALLSRTRRTSDRIQPLIWDCKTLGDWAEAIDGADVVINLAGRSVNCRYTAQNLAEMMSSRVESTRAIGQAISLAKRPPNVWLQASTATIYSHRFDAPNDEITGILGGDEPNAPPKWQASIAVAKAWEQALLDASTPNTRKIALRSAMTMANTSGSVFDVLAHLARQGLGGTLAGGQQYVSWVHQDDFNRSLLFLLDHTEIDGAVNVCSPNPLPQREFSAILRRALGARIGLPTTRWMLEIGAYLKHTESELVLKSRRVVPTRLLQAGFEFSFPEWGSACRSLISGA